MMYKVYKITHPEDNRQYVGITSNDLQLRWKQHSVDKLSALYDILQTDSHKMTMHLLAETDSKQEALDIEQQYICTLGTAYPNGWNRQVKTVRATPNSSTKPKSLLLRKKTFAEWRWNSVTAFSNKCYATYTELGGLIQINFHNGIVENAIWCTAPRPHVLDMQFEMYANDMYYLVSYNDHYKSSQFRSVSFTVHTNTWCNIAKKYNTWQYGGTYFSRVANMSYARPQIIVDALISEMRVPFALHNPITTWVAE